jgi:transcriptional regulator with XRE-family HTH domain
MRMDCEKCGVAMVDRMTTNAEPYRYRLSGLPVGLVGIEVFHCPKCNAQSPIIPRLSELHQVIAGILVRKPAPLTGEEIRFLRKQIGLPAQLLLGVSPAHLSRVENGYRSRLGAPADRLARVAAAKANDNETQRDALLKLADELYAQKKKRRKARFSSLYTLQAHRWTADPAA